MPEELFALRGHGGQRFADFVSALIRAEGAATGAKSDEVQTNTRVSVPDGGVDAQSQISLGGPLQLGDPSSWQFKATPFADITQSELRKEAHKREAKRLIEAGYVYCVVVCDDTAPNKVSALKVALAEIVHGINPAAPSPRVLSAGDLADWASHHPSIVLSFFRQNMRDALAYEPWLRSERAALSRFIELTSRAGIADRIREHVGPKSTGRPVLTIAGPVGSGLSRLVAETLAGVAERVIYVPDATAAVGLFTSLINHPQATAVLVLDHCPGSIRQAIEDLLRGEWLRFRVVAIHDAAEHAATATVRVAKLEDADVQQIIEMNFSEVPPSHRRAFVHFAHGLPKIATVLASAYVENRAQFLVYSSAWAEEQVSRLVPDRTDLRCLQMLSLFVRVGYAGEMSGQLEAICPLFGLEPKDVVRRTRRLSTAPGVVEVGPRYLSVRPQLFARGLFEAAWQQLDELPRWMTELPPALRVSFLDQAGQHGHPAAREALVDWAMPWLRSLEPPSINSVEHLTQLLPLVAVSRNRVGPVFLRLVIEADDDVARSPGPRFERWPARQHVLWKLIELLERRETYFLAERALFRLARAEGQTGGKGQRGVPSATEPWGAAYRLYLSGTEVSFQERLDGLSNKLDTLGEAAVELVTVALDSALNEHPWRMEGVPVAGGDLRPVHWHPATPGELRACLDRTLSLLGRCILSPGHGAAAFKVAMRHGRGIMQGGGLAKLRAILEARMMDNDLERVELFDLVGEYLRYDTAGASPEYVQTAKAWLGTLERHDLRGQLFAALSVGDMRARLGDAEGWNARLQSLGAGLFEQPLALGELLPSLLNDAHHPGGLITLGVAIGTLDSSARHLPSMVGAAAEAKVANLVYGYVAGLAAQGEIHDSAVKTELDALERSNPSMAVELNEVNNRVGSSAARALRLVRARTLPATFLGRNAALRSQPALLVQALDELLKEPEDDLEANVATAIDMLGYFAWDQTRTLPEDAASSSAIWRVMNAAATHGAGSHVHTWQALLRPLFERDPARAIRLVCSAAVTGHYALRLEAVEKLIEFARRSPELVLDHLGPLLLNAKAGHAFLSRTEGALIGAFPYELLRKWIQDNGVAAARAIARYLERPNLDVEVDKAVSPLTEFVLSTFEEDDEVFQNFCSQGSRPGLVVVDVPLLERRIELLQRFRTHPLRRLSDWAEQGITSERLHAQYWREHQEERYDN